MRALCVSLVALACARPALVEPAPFEKRAATLLFGRVVDRVDPYTRADEVARRMASDGWCGGAVTFVPCHRGTTVIVKVLYRDRRVIGLELLAPRGAFAEHRRALVARYGPPTREDRLAADWRVAANWRVRLERRRGALRELHSYGPD